MPRVSRQSAGTVVDRGAFEDRSEAVGGYTVDFVTIRQDSDLAPLLKGLPGDACPCPHWGYLFSGRITVRYGDRQEVVEPGDAYYMAPGHVPAADAGSEFVQWSPSAELAVVQEAMERNAQALQGG
jgi:hypothetical protein